MSRYLSEKLRLISFICIVLVLYIHSNFHYADAGEVGMMLNSYLQQVISGMIGGLAVPMFFAIFLQRNGRIHQDRLSENTPKGQDSGHPIYLGCNVPAERLPDSETQRTIGFHVQ